MRRYVMVSGVFFTLLTTVQLVRLLLNWPVNVAGKEIPIWLSGVAALIVGSFAAWAFRVSAAQHSRDAAG